MLSRIGFLSIILASVTSFAALSLPPQIVEKREGIDDIFMSLASALGRAPKTKEMNQVRAILAQVEAQRSAPQKVVNVLGLFEANAMVCVIGQGSALLARVGGTGCIDLTYEPGTRYVMTGAEFQTDVGGSVEGALGLLVYVGPASMKPYVGGYGVTGGILGIPIPFVKAGARTKYFANLDKQFMVFGGASLGISGQPLPVNFSAGAISVTKTDWMAGLRGEAVGAPDVSLPQRIRDMYGNVVQFFRNQPVTTYKVIVEEAK